MALEDRCSPQTAPTPPSGLPHSPLNQAQFLTSTSTAAALLDMSLGHTDTANMLPHTVASLYQQQQLQQLQQLHHLQQLHQQQLAAGVFQHPGYDLNSQARLSVSPGAHSTSSTPASSLTIKEEESDSIMGDSFNGDHDQVGLNGSNVTEDEDEADIDVDVDEDDIHRTPPPAHQQSSKPTLAFSISNILSDRIGQHQQQQLQSKETTNTKHNSFTNASSIFRPFHESRAATATPSAFTRVDLLELSRQQQAAAAAATAAMMLERANILNCFNPAAYPRIHEEILQSRMRRTGILPAPNNSAQQSPAHLQQSHNMHAKSMDPLLSSPALSCSSSSSSSVAQSALGSLCKTVSQIGQTNPVTPPAASTPSCSSVASLSSPPPSLPNNNTTASSTTSSALSSCASSSSSSLNSSPTSRKNTSPQPIPPPSAISRDSGMESSDDTKSETGSTTNSETGKNEMWPAWVFCTRYSDRPSSGPRYRRPKQPKDKTNDEKRPRTAFSSEQLVRLKREFNENRYLTERRRQQLSSELGLNEAQIKIWFQNKRAKIKKSSGSKNPLALQLMAQGLYNHTTVPLTKEEEELEMRMNGQIP